MVVTTPCAVCATPYARIEVIAPGEWPVQWTEWATSHQSTFIRLHRKPERWHLLVDHPPDRGYDLGESIGAARAAQIVAAFKPPLSYAQVHTAGLYDDAGFCDRCDAPYCYPHWNVSYSGLGTCPRGHGKSLDPHWRPDCHPGIAG